MCENIVYFLFNNKKIEFVNKFLWILILMSVAFNILFLMKYNFDGDSSFYITLAQEQIRTKSLFPEGMCYSTGLFVLTPNLLIIPFLFLTDDLILARQAAILVLWVFLYFILYKIFVTKSEKNIVGFIISSSFFSVFYINSVVVFMHFYQGAYIGYLLFQCLYLALMSKIISNNSYEHKNYAFLLFIFILANLGDIRNLLIWGIPGLISFFLYMVLNVRENFSLLIKKNLQEKIFLRVILHGVLLGFIAFTVMEKLYGNSGTTLGMIELAAKDYGKSFLSIIIGIFNLYGNSFEASLFSVNGVMKLINFFMVFILNIFLPLIAIRNFYQIKWKSGQYLVLFSLVSTFIYFIIAFFTGAAITEDRYLIPIYNNNIILLSVVVGYTFEKNFKKYRTLGVFCILIYVLLNNIVFLYNQKDSLIYQKFGTFSHATEGVAEYLESKGLKYGYGSFENAESYSILSNNKVMVRSIFIDKGGIHPFYWLTAKHFFDPKYYVGESFLMLSDEEIKFLGPKGLETLNLGLPKEKLKYKNFSIFVFDYNISVKFSKGVKVYWLLRGDKLKSGFYVSKK